MAGIHSELEPEVKISLTESWIASLAAVAALAPLADVGPHHETERGPAAKVLGRTGSEGVREGFREQSWTGCFRASF